MAIIVIIAINYPLIGFIKNLERIPLASTLD